MKIKDIGEFKLIERLAGSVSAGEGTIVGIGDDAAVLGPSASGMLTLFTADMLVEGRHFDLAEVSPYRVGWKALGCSLSDIAAMGGLPRAAVVSLGAPGELELEFCAELYRGIGDLARRFGCGIVGGDTVGSPHGLIVSVALLGEVEKEKLVLRSGAERGDELWVTGRLGGSGSGRHLDFTPRVEEARYIIESFPVKAMMDISDGLANDLHRMAAASGVGVLIDGERVPVGGEAPGGSSGKDSLGRALYDGEDFELLFACVPSRTAPELEREFGKRFDCGVTRIGRVVDREKGVTISEAGTERPLEEGGFRHFG